ncbi:unnamed protein product [Ixodes persulcatus]
MATLMALSRSCVRLCKHVRSACLQNVVPAQAACVTSLHREFAKLQVRCYATQKHQKLILAAQKRNRQRKLEKPKEKEKLHWMKRTSKDSLLKPRRDNFDHLDKNPPVDDVYFLESFVPPVYAAVDAIEMHRESHHPTVLDDADAFLYAFVELDLRTKKKNRYRDNFAGTVLFNHGFEFTKRQKRILALCKNTDLATEALGAGAEVAGGSSVIKRILTGELDTKRFDHVLAHVDIMADLPQLRGLLKTKLPSAANGTVANDLNALVKSYLKGVDFVSNSDSHELDYGFLEVPVGRLSMPTEHLTDNLRTLLETVDGFRPKNTNPGTFITKVELKCPPTDEKFAIASSEFLEAYIKTEQEVEDQGGEEEEEEKEEPKEAERAA